LWRSFRERTRRERRWKKRARIYGKPSNSLLRQTVRSQKRVLTDGRTKVVSTSLFYTTDERDGMLNSGMEGGLNESYAALDRLLAKTA
jgi:uncharacterized protein YndB with AHSA1/START domain